MWLSCGGTPPPSQACALINYLDNTWPLLPVIAGGLSPRLLLLHPWPAPPQPANAWRNLQTQWVCFRSSCPIGWAWYEQMGHDGHPPAAPQSAPVHCPSAWTSDSWGAADPLEHCGTSELQAGCGTRQRLSDSLPSTHHSHRARGSHLATNPHVGRATCRPAVGLPMPEQTGMSTGSNDTLAGTPAPSTSPLLQRGAQDLALLRKGFACSSLCPGPGPRLLDATIQVEERDAAEQVCGGRAALRGAGPAGQRGGGRFLC